MSGIFHLIEQQNGGAEHVHSIILTADEARDSLLAEFTMHVLGGWKARIIWDTTGHPVAVQMRRRKRDGTAVERFVTFREFDVPVPGAVYPHEC